MIRHNGGISVTNHVVNRFKDDERAILPKVKRMTGRKIRRIVRRMIRKGVVVHSQDSNLKERFGQKFEIIKISSVGGDLYAITYSCGKKERLLITLLTEEMFQETFIKNGKIQLEKIEEKAEAYI